MLINSLPKVIVEDKSLEIIQETIKDARLSKMYEESEIREKAKDFYNGLQFADKYLANYGYDTKKFPPHTLNLTRKIINKISLVYKYPPERYLGENSEKDPYVIFMANNPQFNISLKEAERQKNLLGNILYRVHYDDEMKMWRPFIETDFQAWFTDENTLFPFAYSIPVKQNIRHGKVKNVEWVFWSNEDYFFYDNFGEIRYDKNHQDGKNPFGIMPLFEMRDNFPIDEWVTYGAVDLVNANNSININLMNINYMIHWQGHNRPYIRGPKSDKIDAIDSGADKVLFLGDENYDAGILDPNPKITESLEAIKAEIEQIAWTYNLSVDWQVSGTAPSGFSLIVKNIDLLEAREDDVELAKMHEKQLYKIISRIGNTLGVDRIPEDQDLMVDFADIDFPVNQKDKIERWKYEFEINAKSPVDYIQSQNTDMSREDAVRIWEENKKLNRKYRTLTDRFSELGGVVNEPEIGTKPEE